MAEADDSKTTAGQSEKTVSPRDVLAGNPPLKAELKSEVLNQDSLRIQR